ncbi:hypothetical protein Pelo_11197 [Pelomyxa schiedti]|nr:hypothetical protein Pelo_11197 [Pelomyxa schiedti]
MQQPQPPPQGGTNQSPMRPHRRPHVGPKTGHPMPQQQQPPAQQQQQQQQQQKTPEERKRHAFGVAKSRDGYFVLKSSIYSNFIIPVLPTVQNVTHAVVVIRDPPPLSPPAQSH